MGNQPGGVSQPGRSSCAVACIEDYADRLAVHVNHLNKVLKQQLGHTTSELLAQRFVAEAKRLLQEPAWTISQISDSLGFAEVADFSHFFKRHTALSPAAFRSA